MVLPEISLLDIMGCNYIAMWTDQWFLVEQDVYWYSWIYEYHYIMDYDGFMCSIWPGDNGFKVTDLTCSGVAALWVIIMQSVMWRFGEPDVYTYEYHYRLSNDSWNRLSNDSWNNARSFYLCFWALLKSITIVIVYTYSLEHNIWLVCSILFHIVHFWLTGLSLIKDLISRCSKLQVPC